MQFFTLWSKLFWFWLVRSVTFNWFSFYISQTCPRLPLHSAHNKFRDKNLSQLRRWHRFGSLILLTIPYESGFFMLILKRFQKITPRFRSVCIVICLVDMMQSLFVSSCSRNSGPPSDRKVDIFRKANIMLAYTLQQDPKTDYHRRYIMSHQYHTFSSTKTCSYLSTSRFRHVIILAIGNSGSLLCGC